MSRQSSEAQNPGTQSQPLLPSASVWATRALAWPWLMPCASLSQFTCSMYLAEGCAQQHPPLGDTALILLLDGTEVEGRAIDLAVAHKVRRVLMLPSWFKRLARSLRADVCCAGGHNGHSNQSEPTYATATSSAALNSRGYCRLPRYSCRRPGHRDPVPSAHNVRYGGTAEPS
jgi:hypothetical protein